MLIINSTECPRNNEWNFKAFCSPRFSKTCFNQHNQRNLKPTIRARTHRLNAIQFLFYTHFNVFSFITSRTDISVIRIKHQQLKLLYIYADVHWLKKLIIIKNTHTKYVGTKKNFFESYIYLFHSNLSGIIIIFNWQIIGLIYII